MSAKENQSNETQPLGNLMTRAEVLRYFQISTATLWRWGKKGILKPYGVQGRIYFKRDEVERVIVEL